jgi:hypothetical protein
MATTKSKLQMEYNKTVTSADPGQVYVCFSSFVKFSRVWVIAAAAAPKAHPLWIRHSNKSFYITSYIDSKPSHLKKQVPVIYRINKQYYSAVS